jgi:nitrous oxide reductase
VTRGGKGKEGVKVEYTIRENDEIKKRYTTTVANGGYKITVPMDAEVTVSVADEIVSEVTKDGEAVPDTYVSMTIEKKRTIVDFDLN